MACFNPVPAYRTDSGDVVMVERGSIRATLTLACGRCTGCRVERARQWTVRVMHEASLYEENCFVTLTYAPEHLPADGSLRYRPDFQNFLKRLRRHFSCRCVGASHGSDCRARNIRFFMCGEYGEEGNRPHYHAALFNVDFREDAYVWKDSGSGHVVYRSPTLERLWPFGSSSFGALTQESAAYVARYAMKKVYGDLADEHYKDVDRETGEVTWRVPEFTHMSLKPGIGAGWFSKFRGDVFPHDRVVVGGVESRPPRYYDTLMKRLDRDLVEELKMAREARARERWQDNTPERLASRETVAKARLAFFRRKLK